MPLLKEDRHISDRFLTLFAAVKTGINPFTAKCDQRQISTKVPNERQMASCESTGRELSSEGSHHRISSIDSKVRVTSQNSLKHAGSERVKIVAQMIRSEDWNPPRRKK